VISGVLWRNAREKDTRSQRDGEASERATALAKKEKKSLFREGKKAFSTLEGGWSSRKKPIQEKVSLQGGREVPRLRESEKIIVPAIGKRSPRSRKIAKREK